MQRHLMGVNDTPAPAAFAHASDYRMSGGEQRLARDPDLMAFLAKVYAEVENERRPWPMFDARRLGKFLGAAGIDVDAALKADADAMSMPAIVNDTAACMDKFNGASFLTQPSGQACYALKRRSQLANTRQA